MHFTVLLEQIIGKKLYFTLIELQFLSDISSNLVRNSFSFRMIKIIKSNSTEDDIYKTKFFYAAFLRLTRFCKVYTKTNNKTKRGDPVSKKILGQLIWDSADLGHHRISH